MKNSITRFSISFILVITILLSVVTEKNLLAAGTEEYRNGLRLSPMLIETTGIDINTSFFLEANKALTLEEVKKSLSFEPAFDFEVIKFNKGFQIKPLKALNYNEIYKITFENTSWVYQTMKPCTLLETFPENESINVPINTGIEFNFTHEGANVKDYFKITPYTEGSFINNGTSVAFMPKQLKEKTIYTVTLNKGMTFSGSKQVLDRTIEFSFETTSKDENYVEPIGYFSFQKILNDFSSLDYPKLPITYALYNDTEKDEINATVYKYNSLQDALSAIKDYNSLPYWSIYNDRNSMINLKNTKKVLSFEQPLDKYEGGSQFLDFPEKLGKGFYLIHGEYKEIDFYTFVQVTDMSCLYVDSEEQDLVWVNSLNTKKPIKGVSLTNENNKNAIRSDENGIIKLNKDFNSENNIIVAENNEDKTIILTNQNRFFFNQKSNNYWRYVQSDRTIYKPDSEVEFWGFLKSRYSNQEVTQLTAELKNIQFAPYYRKSNIEQIPYITEKISVTNGFYQNSIKLPNLDKGNYQIDIKNKEEVVSTIYIQVENYIKPEYKIDVISNKKAVFVDESIVFNTAAMFFEGTPVANLDYRYAINYDDYFEGSGKTGNDGKGEIIYTPKYREKNQGETYLNFIVTAKLPEAGEIIGQSDVRVFNNNINLKNTAKIENKKLKFTTQINKIDLKPLNDENVENDDKWIGIPTKNKAVEGSIYKNEWIKKKTGEYYDYINKKVEPYYEYEIKKTLLDEWTINTDQKGFAEYEYSLLEEGNCYYTVDIATKDDNGRKMTFTEYYYGNNYQQNSTFERYYLKSDKETYNEGETVNISFMNNEEKLGSGNYLYIAAQNGIKKYNVSNKPDYQFAFDKAAIPNISIMGFYFNGNTYINAEQALPRFNVSSKNIIIQASTDKSSYKPGDVCKINIQANMKNVENKLIPAKDVTANIAIVDEAIFKLSEQYVDTLESLYEWVPDGVYGIYSTHNNGIFDNYIATGMGGDHAEATKNDSSFISREVTDNSNIRTIFKDTAIFKNIKLDANGRGTIEFTLPDNITSWRITYSAISNDLSAGSKQESIKVTLPMFTNTIFNSSYLEGDDVFVALSTYGSILQTNQIINYNLKIKETGYQTKLQGKAFEKSYLPLGKLKKGSYTLEIQASTEQGISDILEKNLVVEDTRHRIVTADYYELKNNLNLTTNDNGNTKLLIIDKGKGKFINKLYNLAFSNGYRIDQKLIAEHATEILNKEFDENLTLNNTDIANYLKQDGGIGVLPYSESNLETTVKLLNFVKEDVNLQNIKEYLYNCLSDSNQSKAAALYGLAQLGEKVLPEMNKLMQADNLSLEDTIYLALAYSSIKDDYTAKTIFDRKIKTSLKEYDIFTRVEEGKNENEYLENTALLLMLASDINLSEKDKLYRYTADSYSDKILVSTELLYFIQNEIIKVENKPLEIKYTYDNIVYAKKIEAGQLYNFTIPSSKLNDLIINEVKGEGAIISIYSKSGADSIKNQQGINAKRSYLRYSNNVESNTFQVNDIVKVKIEWSLDKNLPDNTYTLTDYAPSGIIPIVNPYLSGADWQNYYYRDIDGQKVSFYLNKEEKEKKELYYLARVISKGEYKAEGIIVQGAIVNDSFWKGPEAKITIK